MLESWSIQKSEYVRTTMKIPQLPLKETLRILKELIEKDRSE